MSVFLVSKLRNFPPRSVYPEEKGSHLSGFASLFIFWLDCWWRSWETCHRGHFTPNLDVFVFWDFVIFPDYGCFLGSEFGKLATEIIYDAVKDWELCLFPVSGCCRRVFLDGFYFPLNMLYMLKTNFGGLLLRFPILSPYSLLIPPLYVGRFLTFLQISDEILATKWETRNRDHFTHQ